MIKGVIRNIEFTSPETHHVSTMYGDTRKIVTRKGACLVTFEVTNVDGHNPCEVGDKFVLVPAESSVVETPAVVDCPPAILLPSTESTDRGSW